MMQSLPDALHKGQRYRIVDEFSCKLPARQNTQHRSQSICVPSFAHKLSRHLQPPGQCRRAQKAAAAECGACTVPSVEENVIQKRLRFVLKAAGLMAAFYAWFCYSKARSSSLFASTLASPAGHQGIKTAGGSAWAGLAAGCLHSLSGPDHLAALTPLTLGRTSVRASLLGAWWGFGHCIGQLILGLLMLLLKEHYHNMVPMLDKYSSLTIGLTLVTIGVLGLYETLHEGHAEAEPTAEQPPLAFSGAAVAGTVPVEPTPASLLEAASESSKREKLKGFSLWTLSTGIIYGLQPDALFVVIPALALPTKLAAAAYMSMFVAGTVAAMGSYTAFIGATSSAMKARGGWFKVERLSAVASGIAIVMGIIIATGGNVSLPFLSHSH